MPAKLTGKFQSNLHTYAVRQAIDINLGTFGVSLILLLLYYVYRLNELVVKGDGLAVIE